jgi:hypothetical protein
MVKLKVYNTMYERRTSYFFEIPEFNYYEGDEVKVKWVKPEEIALSTGLKDFSFRVIQRKYIREIDGKPYSFEVKDKKEEVRLVQGSNGKVYEVTSHSCTCPGFTFRGSCKHIGVK